jgi:hypothetical protein
MIGAKPVPEQAGQLFSIQSVEWFIVRFSYSSHICARVRVTAEKWGSSMHHLKDGRVVSLSGVTMRRDSFAPREVAMVAFAKSWRRE